jgi:adenylyl cyclase-associated protein
MAPKKAAPPAMPKTAPPPPEKFENTQNIDPMSSGMAAVMNELTSGEKVHLKRVTDDMKTKNRKEEEDIVMSTVPQPPPTKTGPSDAAPCVMAPVCEIQRSNWVVENYVNHPEVLKLDNCNMKQVVYVSKCVNSTVYVDCKVKSITLDGCKRVNLIVHSVISSVELVNCERCKIHSINELPSLSIDKCAGVSITLSPRSLDCAFTTSKSSEMNVSVPVGNPDDGDYKEMPIPEQFVHKVQGIGNNSKITTEVSGLYH